MKKRHIAMLSLGALMACTLGLGVFTACDEGGGDAVKPSEYLDGINYYYGDGNDVHLQGWFVSENNDAWKVEEGVSDGGSTVTKLGFNKNTANNSFSVQIDGEYSDFKYLNITMRAEARGSDRAIAAHLSVANPIPQKDHLNVLGSDLYFDVSADVYTTYTFLVPSVSRQTLDVADYVRLAPDPGIQNAGTTLYTGDIYVKDCWFSKEAPADGVTPVDDTWRTEAWCGYTVTRGGADSEATISYEHPADWSRFYRPVPLEEVFLEDGTVNNMLRIRFTSDAVTVGDVTLEDSVEQFQVGLWGDPDPTSDAQFWQSWFGQYSSYGFANGSHSSAATMTVEKDEETGIITLTCQAAPALIGLAGNFEEQLWICFNLESQPQGGEPGGAPGYIAENTPFDGVGQMTILSSEFYYDETMPEYREPVENESGWSQNGVGAYVISSEKAGVMANVTFDNISPTAWSCLAYDASSGGKTVAVLTLRNNGSEKVLYGIDWNSEANRQYGFLEAGETKEVRLENASASGVINFFLDSCYDANDPTRLPDKEEYSGDVDIVSLTYEEGDTPVVPVTPGWAGAAVYTVSEKDGITNVVYEGIAPSGWTCIAYDTADANGKTAAILTIRNNGTEKVLYGIDWNDQNARVYGFLEAGETKEVRVENASASGPINFFIDSCYDANDPTRLPEKDSYSGNVDILSLVYADGPAPVVPSDSAWTGAAIYTVSEKDGVTNVTYEGVGPQDWTCIAYGVTDEIRRPVVFLTLRNNGEKKMLYGIDLDNADARVYGYLEPGEIKQLRLESAEAYTVINFYLDSCYDGAPYESYTDSYSGDIDILALEFAAEDEVIDITANTDKVFPTGRVKLTWTAANGADVTVSCTKDGAPAEDMTPVFGEYMTITELGTYVFTFEADGAVTAVWVVRCVERPIYVPDPEPDPEPESAWTQNGNNAYDFSEQSDGSLTVTYDKTEGPADWSCVTFDASDKIKDYNTVAVTLRNNGSVPAYVGVNWGSDTDTYATERKYVTIAAGAKATIEVPYYGSTLSRAIDASVNIFIDSCYASVSDKPTTFSGSVTIVSVDFSNKEPAETSPWSGAGVYTVTAEEGVSNVTYSGVSPTGWTCVSYQVSDDERQNTVIVTLRNNGTEKVLYGINLDDPNARVYGYLEVGETKEVKVQSTNAYTAIDLFLDSCYYGDPYAPEKDSYSGNVDILGVKFTAEQPEQPEQPEEPDDPEPEEIYGKGTWGVVDSGKTFYTFTAKEGTMTNVTYQGVSPELWANLYYEVSEEECYQNVTVTLRNNGTIKVLYGIDLGDVTKRAYGWIEPGATAEIVLSSDIVYSTINFFLDDCYYGDPYVAPEGTLSGDVDIVSVAFSGELLQKPAEPSGPVTISLTWGLNNDATLISLAGNVVTLNGIVPDGAWQQINAGISLESKAVTLKLSVTNSTNALAKFKLCVMDEGWQQIGADSSASVCWIEIPKDATWDIVLTLTAEEAVKAAHLMLAIDCWASTDATCPDEDAFTGTVTINSLTVS